MEKFIYSDGDYLSFRDGKLFDVWNREYRKVPYQCISLNYPAKHFFIIIQKRCFVWNTQTKYFSQIPYEPIGDSKKYFHTSTDGDEDGKGIVAFEIKENGKALIMGRSFLKIAENLYKIGSYAYQFVKGEMQQLCSCASFETFERRVEINTEKDGKGEEFIFERRINSSLWQCVRHTRSGNCAPEPLPKFY